MFKIELSPIKEINFLIVDFFRKKHMKEISWKEELVDEKVQEELISKTLDSRLVKSYKMEITYQRRFLKAFMFYLDQKKVDICGSAYKALCRLSTGQEEEFYHVFYPIFELSKLDTLSQLNTVILKENVNIISGGTTGLVTWQAAQALAEWALSTDLDNTTVLELGSGAGMSGLVVASSTGCSRYVFTDSHPDVLSLLKENVALNCTTESLSYTFTRNCIFEGKVGDCTVEVRPLDWEAKEPFVEMYGRVDTIFAADVVYDPSLFEPLLATIKAFLENGTEWAIVAFTRRLDVTVESFTEKIVAMDMEVDWLKTLEPKYLSWEVNPVIHIVSITLKTDY